MRGVTGVVEPNSREHSEVSTSPKSHAFRAKIQLGAIYGSMLVAGWNDGTSGPLIPKMQEVYHVQFLLVSVIFVLASVGYISGALINMRWTNSVSFGKILIFGALCQAAAYAIQAPAPPFPLFVISFALSGIGIAIQNAQANAYVASLEHNSEIYMGMLHARYGAGALTSPLIATQFSQTRHWSFHYLVSLGLAISNVVILTLTFRFRTLDESLARIGEAVPETNSSDRSNFRQILSIKTVHVLAFFILVYVGVEVTIGGWITTYIIDVRGGGASAGYISSGFFGGIMVGRLALLWLNRKIGEYRALFLYIALAIGLELVVWFVPSLIGGAVAVALTGVFLGPMYPIVMNHAGRVVPRRLLAGSVGWIAGLGQVGSAILPFITGAIASKTGIRALQPLLVSLMCLFPVLWGLVPLSRRID
ncbi:major facilitator superfamily domain-containing protein [Mycena albidolilacea]|uniref:Major facilitator superfamily domain-containing protein n=1 Tax=Mycena albidolilacea TaxID=1033008 RepID=A0AAD7AB76_9AGAR|nr:major facilitator superfamily domain-containing protein [Mycena albidolilacea]